MTKKSFIKPTKVLAIAVILALVFILSFVISIYISKTPNAFSKKLVKTSHLPAAFVNGQGVELSDFYVRIDLAKKINSNFVLDKATQSELINKMVDQKVVENLLRERQIRIYTKEQQNYYDLVSKVTFAQPDFKSLALSEKDLKNQIVFPEFNQMKLQQSLAEDKQLNADVWTKANDIMDQLKNGAVFDDLANKLSEDPQTASIGGEMGFVGYNDVVPEIYYQIREIKDKNPHIIASRFGLHIIVVKSNDNKGPNQSTRYHLQQIYLKTADYSQWFAKQKNNYQIIKLK